MYETLDYSNEIKREAMKLLKSFKGKTPIGIGSSKIAFLTEDYNVIVIPLCDEGASEIQSQIDKWSELSSTSVANYLNPVIEFGSLGYYLISPLLNELTEYHSPKEILVNTDDPLIWEINVEEAFSKYNVGLSQDGNIKSFDYGEYNPYMDSTPYCEWLHSKSCSDKDFIKNFKNYEIDYYIDLELRKMKEVQ